MTDMTPAKATALRKPFPPESVGQLPKGGAMLDFVGHAAVTDRLLSVDPDWSWEPFAIGPDGLPAMDAAGNLWIRLTICGVTRIGVGDGKNQKERIGDAIRNAAMRFGVALDLWAKENLVEFAQAVQNPPSEPDELEAGLIASVKANQETQAMRIRNAANQEAQPMRAGTRGQMFAEFARVGIDENHQLSGINSITGGAYTSRGDLTEADAKRVIADLKKRQSAPKPVTS